MSLTLLDYLPTPAELDPTQVISIRDRLQNFINQLWPELDTRPNSVFGDLHLTPLATLISAIEIAKNKWMSDLDLSQVQRGIVFNPDFVTSYLNSLGVTSRNAVSSTGTIRLTFTDDLDYTFDIDASFIFGNRIFKVNPTVGNPVQIFSTSAQTAQFMLTKTSDGLYVVHLPVSGPAGSKVSDGDSATASLTFSQLSGVVAVGNFDTGLLPETLPQLATKAQFNFASANLTSRSGIKSYITLRFPNIMGASATITGDIEMMRPGKTPLGLLEGAIDAFVKSEPNYLADQTNVQLVYDYVQRAWVGRLTFPSIPAFMDTASGIFQVGNFQNERGVNQIYSKSSHPYVDNYGVAYSRYEILGIKIQDTAPSNFAPSTLSAVDIKNSDGTVLQVQGEYLSDIFNAKPGRNVTLRIDSVVTIDSQNALQVNVRDSLTGETGIVYFIPNAPFSPIEADLATNKGDYTRMLNGLAMKLVPPSGTLILSDMVGFVYQFSFQGRVSDFTVNYFYDPIVTAADAIIQNPDNKPVNVSVFTRSFLICHINSFIINYRIPWGAQLDQNTARTAISNYINSITFPASYEESRIGTLMTLAGGSGVMSISKRGVFYPSIGSIYVDRNGNQTQVPRIPTNTLVPPVNVAGIGLRNITYLLDPSDITFNATIR